MLFLMKSTAKSAIVFFWFPEGFSRWEEPPMPTLGKTPLDFQRAAFEGTLAASQRMTAGFLRLLSMQQRMLAGGPCRRETDGGGTLNRSRIQCRLEGVDLQYHYGRRNHDVDVERL